VGQRATDIYLALVDDPDCIALMALFIQDRPELWHEDIAAR